MSFNIVEIQAKTGHNLQKFPKEVSLDRQWLDLFKENKHILFGRQVTQSLLCRLSISKAVVSSTNLILRCQFRSRLFVMAANRITPSLVPCGIPPFGDFQSERELPILTACFLFVRKALIQLINTG